MSIMICKECSAPIDTDFHEMYDDLCENCADEQESLEAFKELDKVKKEFFNATDKMFNKKNPMQANYPSLGQLEHITSMFKMDNNLKSHWDVNSSKFNSRLMNITLPQYNMLKDLYTRKKYIKINRAFEIWKLPRL